MMRQRGRLLLGSISALAIVTGCPGFFPVTVVSDVPCITPSWEGALRFVFRNERPVGGRILFTVQTVAQANRDPGTGFNAFREHEEVYAYDTDTESLELVDDDVWDTATGSVRLFSSSSASTDKFQLYAEVNPSGLSYMGQSVPVAGGNPSAVLSSFGDGPIVAVVSTNGFRRPGLFSSGGANGQYFHQLFSEDTGQAVGPAVRLGIGNGTDYIMALGAWTSDDRYVVYKSGSTFCIADGISE